MRIYLILLCLFLLIKSPLAVVEVITPAQPVPNISFPEKAQPNNSERKAPPEVLPPLVKDTTNKKDYLSSLFDEIEVAKKAPPPLSDIKLYDKLANESIALGVLKENPNLRVGQLSFRPLSHNAQHAREISKGQELLVRDFGNKSYSYKQMTDTIAQQIADPKSPLTDMDWILMANAFRTLKAPGGSHQTHILGGLLSEFVLLQEINKLEHKTPLTMQDRSLLSTLHYDLAQLYQFMYKNDEDLFKKGPTGHYLFPIDPVYLGDQPGYDYPLEYLVPIDSLVATRLDLLENALLFYPDDDTWAQIIDFMVFDLLDPWFYNELTPAFWADYFPFGLRHDHVERLRHMWNGIRHNRDVRENHSIRLNQIGGERAFKRLSVVHARPTSRFNHAINKSLGRAHQAIPPSKSKPLFASDAKPPKSKHKKSSQKQRDHSSTTLRTQQQFIPHHATTGRSTSYGEPVKHRPMSYTPNRGASVHNQQDSGPKANTTPPQKRIKEQYRGHAAPPDKRKAQ
jgi:hypothetical protein